MIYSPVSSSVEIVGGHHVTSCVEEVHERGGGGQTRGEGHGVLGPVQGGQTVLQTPPDRVPTASIFKSGKGGKKNPFVTPHYDVSSRSKKSQYKQTVCATCTEGTNRSGPMVRTELDNLTNSGRPFFLKKKKND